MRGQKQTQSHSSAFVAANFNGLSHSKLSVMQGKTQSNSSFVSMVSLRPAPVASVEGSLRFQQRQGTARMNLQKDATQQQQATTDTKPSQQGRDQPFVLGSDFANQSVGSTIDDMFSDGLAVKRTVTAVPTPAPVELKGFRGLMHKLLNSPNYTMVGDDIYTRDLAFQNQSTPVAIPRTQLPNKYESKINVDKSTIQSILRWKKSQASPADLTFGRSAGSNTTQAPYKSVSMMSQALHESH